MVVETERLAKEIHLAQAGLPSLPGDWDVVEIGDLLSEDRPISVGVMYPGRSQSGGVPLIRVGDLSGSMINPQPEFLIASTVHHEYRRTELAGGELLMTLVGGLGQCAVVPKSMAGWNAARAVAVMRLKDPSDAKFLRLCLLSKPLQFLINAWANTTVQATLNLKEIKQLPVPWPCKTERDRIAAVCGAFDDKIELNRRMNEMLEAMAQALFKSRFAMQNGLAEDWPKGRIGDLATLEKGISYKGEFLNMPGLPMVNLGCFKGNGIFDRTALKFYGGEYKERHVIKGGDVVIANTDITQNRRVLGSPAIVPVLENSDRCLFTHHVYAVRLDHDCELWKFYIYYSLLQDEFRERAEGFATGTTVLALPRDAILDFEVPLPSERIVADFNRLVLPLVERCWRNDVESKTLAEVRDALLPKLLSGTVRVKDGPRAV